MIQVAAGEQNTICELIKAALKRRAVRLNNRDVPGRATVIPEYMLDLGKNKNGNDKPTQLILLSIEHDFYELSKQMKAMLLYNKRDKKNVSQIFLDTKRTSRLAVICIVNLSYCGCWFDGYFQTQRMMSFITKLMTL